MAIYSATLYNDMSTLAMFVQWATWISGNFATVGWTQTKETGQVMWSGMSLSAVSMSGSNATYTYASLTGMPLQIGRALTITGMTNALNNGVFVITAVTGTTSGTFTVVNAVGANESGSTGAVTKITSVPGSNAYVYEVWQPNDALTSYILKVEYGSIGGTNSPTMRFTVGLTTNGSGTFYGATTYGNATFNGPFNTNATNYTASGTSIPYACYFSGDSGRISCMMWRNGLNNSPQMFAIERSLNSSGAYTGSHVTVITGGINSSSDSQRSASNQVTLHFTYGAIPTMSSNTWTTTNQGGLSCRVPVLGWTTTNIFVNQSTSLDTVAPHIGFFDYPLTGVGLMNPFGMAEGQVIAATIYGTSHNYLLTTSGFLQYLMPNKTTMLCMRYD